jgi:hypothetical protein
LAGREQKSSQPRGAKRKVTLAIALCQLGPAGEAFGHVTRFGHQIVRSLPTLTLRSERQDRQVWRGWYVCGWRDECAIHFPFQAVVAGRGSSRPSRSQKHAAIQSWNSLCRIQGVQRRRLCTLIVARVLKSLFIVGLHRGPKVRNWNRAQVGCGRLGGIESFWGPAFPGPGML